MAIDMKEIIAQATERLLFDKSTKKLTVKNIVEECHITRQAFYYHFSDIPELLQWILEQRRNQLQKEFEKIGDGEEQIRRFLLLAVNGKPVVKKGMESSYGEELERLFTRQMEDMFQHMAELRGLFQGCTPFERKVITRYHGQAVMGFLRHWSDEDTKNLDEIAHIIFQILSEDGFDKKPEV